MPGSRVRVPPFPPIKSNTCAWLPNRYSATLTDSLRGPPAHRSLLEEALHEVDRPADIGGMLTERSCDPEYIPEHSTSVLRRGAGDGARQSQFSAAWVVCVCAYLEQKSGVTSR